MKIMSLDTEWSHERPKKPLWPTTACHIQGEASQGNAGMSS